MGLKGYEASITRLGLQLRTALLMTLSAMILTVAVTSTTVAQSVIQIRGTVTFKDKEDAKPEPRKDVEVSAYRQDIKGQKPLTVKTNKKGEYVVTLQFRGSYVLVATGENVQAQLFGPFQVAEERKVDFELVPGNGNKPTDQQIADFVARNAAPTTQLTAEQKEAIEKAKEERAKIEAENAKITNDNAAAEKHFKAGLELFKNKSYLEASVEFKEAMKYNNIDAGIPYNAAVALQQAGNEKYNAKDTTAAAALYKESGEIGLKAIAMKPEEPSYKELTARSLRNFGALSRDNSLIEKSIELMKEVIPTKIDPKEKQKIILDIGKTYVQINNKDKAVETFRSYLANDPDNPEVKYELGLQLVADESNKKDFEEGLLLMQDVKDSPKASAETKQIASSVLEAFAAAAEEAKKNKKASGGKKGKGN
ncbi:MAG TPA: hypothetical protein PLL06_12130 [Acidobacteriota bacterium]|nr:hypothetical protein [Acidobacteriota bacterium]HND19108.1 hypothetical protein [Acidobacteriota bacterium]